MPTARTRAARFSRFRTSFTACPWRRPPWRRPQRRCRRPRSPSRCAPRKWWARRAREPSSGAWPGCSPAPISQPRSDCRRSSLPAPATEGCEYRRPVLGRRPEQPQGRDAAGSASCSTAWPSPTTSPGDPAWCSISSCSGPTGHYERLSFWTHFAGAFVFAIYATVRQILVRDDARLAGGLTSAAAWTIAAVFLTSSLYHCTAPDLGFAMVTRVLDYARHLHRHHRDNHGRHRGGHARLCERARADHRGPARLAAASILIVFFVWRRACCRASPRGPSSEITSPVQGRLPPRAGALLVRPPRPCAHPDAPGDVACFSIRPTTSCPCPRPWPCSAEAWRASYWRCRCPPS